VGWRGIKSLSRQFPGLRPAEVKRLVEFPNGGTVQVRSADEPDSLRGEGLDFIVMDEAAYIKEAAWLEALRPALTDRQGRALFISTPNGRNWFYRLWVRGNSNDDPAFCSWQKPTQDNPFIPYSEIVDAQAQLPVAIFEQEYLAEFREDSGVVFRNVRACVYAEPGAVSPEAERRYVMGVDWAQSKDWTVLVVMDAETRQVVDVDRFNQIGWAVQRGRLSAMASRWGCSRILAEHNSIGGPNIEQLQSEGLPVSGFITTSDSKAAVIQALMLAFERQEISILDDPVMIAELESFEATRLPSGKWRYAAASGMHDDTVIALALALEATQRGLSFDLV
jgi:phage FluMu gp28-like protein